MGIKLSDYVPALKYGADIDAKMDVSVADDLTVTDTLTVSGITTLTGATTQTGALTCAAAVTVGTTLGVTGKITGDDIDLASGAIVAGIGTGANGIVLKNPKNAAASSLSGTQLDVEIDIGGTAYHFTVFPTKA